MVKLTGDGALVEFASAVDAVECAVAMQNGMARARGRRARRAAHPLWSAEKFLSATGTFERGTELNLFFDSVEKAGLALCATEKQLARYPDMKRLEQCEAQRASG